MGSSFSQLATHNIPVDKNAAMMFRGAPKDDQAWEGWADSPEEEEKIISTRPRDWVSRIKKHFIAQSFLGVIHHKKFCVVGNIDIGLDVKTRQYFRLSVFLNGEDVGDFLVAKVAIKNSFELKKYKRGICKSIRIILLRYVFETAYGTPYKRNPIRVKK